MEKITVGQKMADTNSRAEYTGKSCSKFLPNDTLMARITPCLENGKIAKYVSDTAGFGSTEFFVLRAKKNKATADYVYYLSQTHYIRQLAVNSMTGASGRQRADAKYIGNIKWNFPDIEIQRKIADILSAYDNLIENNNKRIRLLEQMAENLYKEWFVRFRFPGYEDMEFENGIPKGWEIKLIGKIGNVVGGGTPSTSIEEYWGGDIPWVTPADLSNYSYTFIKAGVKNITTLGLEKSSAKMLPQNTVLLSSRAPVGYVAIAANPICTNQGFKSVVCDTNIVEPYYLYFVLKSNRSLLEQYATGATFPELSASTFRKIKFLIPEISIQKSFANALKDIFKLSADLVEQNKCLMKQRDMLLPRLMSGKLEV